MGSLNNSYNRQWIDRFPFRDVSSVEFGLCIVLENILVCSTVQQLAAGGTILCIIFLCSWILCYKHYNLRRLPCWHVERWHLQCLVLLLS